MSEELTHRFTHVRLLVNHFVECFRFYRDVMGFEPTWGSEEEVYADFDTGTITLALFERGLMAEAIGTSDHPLTVKMQDPICLVLQVEDVDHEWLRLTAVGAQPAAPPTDHPDWGIRTAHVRDPDGNLIEINQPIEQINL